jgi:anti-anti-sigma factor
MPLGELSVTAIDSDPPRLELAGELDLSTAPSFAAHLRTVRLPGEVLVDLRDVSFMDSRGMLALIDAQRDLRLHGGELVLAEVSDPVRKVLELTATWDLFRHEHPTAPSAS